MPNQRDPRSAASRRFSLRDILILVVALGVAFAAIRIMASVDRWSDPSGSSASWEAQVVPAASMILVALSLAVLVSSLVPPRPRLRRLARQPGFLAGVAVASNVVSQTLHRVGPLASGRLTSRNWTHNLLFSWWVPFYVGHAVFLAWLIGLMIGFALRPCDWCERLGRVLGCIWLIYWIVNSLGYFRG